MTAEYVIWSFEHRMWWAPDRAGYTPSLELAGRYTAKEAGEIVTNSIFCEEVAIHEKVVERVGPPTVSGLWETVPA